MVHPFIPSRPCFANCIAFERPRTACFLILKSRSSNYVTRAHISTLYKLVWKSSDDADIIVLNLRKTWDFLIISVLWILTVVSTHTVMKTGFGVMWLLFIKSWINRSYGTWHSGWALLLSLSLLYQSMHETVATTRTEYNLLGVQGS